MRGLNTSFGSLFLVLALSGAGRAQDKIDLHPRSWPPAPLELDSAPQAPSPAGRSTRQGNTEIVRDLGATGYYFLPPPNRRVSRLRVIYPNGRRGLIEWTRSHELILVRLEPGLNR